MSAPSKTTLAAALAAHATETTPDAIVTGYILIASTLTATDYETETTRYLVDCADNQPYHVTLGLWQRLGQILHEASNQ